jgi:4-amino-4-deoxy-L-arabinose transferase-like glycosyltransferase
MAKIETISTLPSRAQHRHFSSSQAWLIFLGLMLAISTNLISLLTLHFHPTEIDFDAQAFYLPAAKQLLQEGLAYFRNEQSVGSPPLAYIYPALLGANAKLVMICNIVLSCVLQLLMFRCVQLLHSSLAGIIAVFLLALHPGISELIPTVLTEPPYLFLCGVWIWGITEAMVTRRAPPALIGGLAFGLAILTRGTFLYFAFLLIIMAFFMWYRAPLENRSKWGLFLIAQTIAVLPPLLFIAKNSLLFGFPQIYSLSGAALYLGAHPLSYGAESAYYGIVDDMGGVLRGLDYRSIAGDSLLTNVAKQIYFSRPLVDLLEFFLVKTSTFVFATKAVAADAWLTLRSWRIGELIFFVIGVTQLRQVWMRWLISVIVLYQLAIYQLVLNTPRYSIGALDLWLIIGAAVGLAWLIMPSGSYFIQSQRYFWRTWCVRLSVLLLVWLAILGGEWHRKNSDHFAPNLDALPFRLVWEMKGDELDRLSRDNFVNLGDGRYRLVANQGEFYIPLRQLNSLQSYRNTVVTLELGVTNGKSCRCKINYRPIPAVNDEYGHDIAFLLSAEKDIHRYHFGGTIGLGLTQQGDIRLNVTCPSGSELTFQRIAISEPAAADYYYRRHLERLP